MKEYYPYTVVPFSVEKIRLEGIPTPKLPKLMLLPEPVTRKYFGTVIFILSLVAFVIFTFFVKYHVSIPYISFLVALISLVATIFEFVQYNQQKKQYKRDYELFLEHKEIYKKIKNEQERILEQNKNENLVKDYQKQKVDEFFKTSYDVIIAVHNEYSPAKKRLKLFLEEYFPDEVLENVKIVHDAKKLEYVPDFVIKFNNPKLNVAIEVEEPYSLSNVPENIQKDYESKDRIRHRFANELGWIVIVLSEEQSIKSPTECCKFIEESIELLFGDIKTGERFINIKTIKKQRVLTGEERANLKNTKYRETYLIEAGLLENQYTSDTDLFKPDSISLEKIEDVAIHNTETIEEFLDQKSEINKNTIEKSEANLIENPIIPAEQKKPEIENEQLQLIKKIAKKVKGNSHVEKTKTIKEEPFIFKTDNSLEVKKEELPDNEKVEINLSEKDKNIDETSEIGEQLRKDEDILKDLYNALDKHSRKQRDKKDKEPVVEIIGEKENIEKQEVNMTAEIKKDENSVISDNQNIEESLETNNNDSEIIELTPADKYEALLENKRLSIEKSERNKELIKVYREKIEGAVFDKAWDELIDLCTRAINEVPSWDWAYYRRSTAWGNKKDFAKVLEDCNKAIGYNPTLADAFYNRGTAKYFLAKYRDSAYDYQKSIDLNYVKKADAHFNRGLCFQKLQQDKIAYNEFVKAKELGSQKAIDLIKKIYKEE